MLSVILGFTGGIAAVGLFGSGFFFGWRVGAHSRPRAERLPEPERRRLREERDAFRKLQNYTVEDAYGLSGIL